MARANLMMSFILLIFILTLGNLLVLGFVLFQINNLREDISLMNQARINDLARQLREGNNSAETAVTAEITQVAEAINNPEIDTTELEAEIARNTNLKALIEGIYTPASTQPAPEQPAPEAPTEEVPAENTETETGEEAPTEGDLPTNGGAGESAPETDTEATPGAGDGAETTTEAPTQEFPAPEAETNTEAAPATEPATESDNGPATESAPKKTEDNF